MVCCEEIPYAEIKKEEFLMHYLPLIREYFLEICRDALQSVSTLLLKNKIS
jgi:hypothetical protein